MEDILYILQKHFNEEPFTSNEEERFVEWIASTENQKEYNKYKGLWELTAPKKVLAPNVQAQWERFSSENIKKTKSLNVLYKYASAIAAAIIIAVTIIAIYQPFGNSMLTYSANNTPINIVLPDGSSVDLNINSTLLVPKNFNTKSRTVELVGEGMFDVHRNEASPFIVKLTEDLMVQVLGTKFNIRNYPNSIISELKVLNGSVSFEKNQKKLILEKNQETTFDKKANTFRTTRAINANHLAWHTNKFEFNNTPLSEAIESLERYLNKTIKVPETALNIRYTGSFDTPTAKDIAEVLSLALSWDYRLTKSSIIFTEKKTQ